jgi:hypothetical protein
VAWIFELAAECGSEREAAVRFGRHFDGVELRLPNDRISLCKFDSKIITTDEEGNAWAEIIPSGISGSGIRDENDAQDMTQAGVALYDKLRSAPAFRFALVGVETGQFALMRSLPEMINHPASHGLVISRSIWEQLGRPDGFESFSDGYLWKPYQGQTSTNT